MDITGNESSKERTFRERILLKTKVPESESSWPFRSRERKFQGANWPGFYWPTPHKRFHTYD